MKSKLFLSLSLLTAVFSMNAKFGPKSISDMYQAQANYAAASNGKDGLTNTLEFLSGLKNAGFAASVLGGTGYVASQYNADQANLEQAELVKLADKINDNRSYLQVAKDSLNTVSKKSSDLYNSAKITASDIYANATYENMKNASVNGFNSTKTFVQENPYKTAGGVAAVAALTYGAYKLYNSDMFAKAQAPVVTSTPAPVKKQVRRPRLNMSSYYGV